jgi:hypothetical protein
MSQAIPLMPAVEDVIPYQLSSHYFQPLGFQTPCLAPITYEITERGPSVFLHRIHSTKVAG